MPEGNNYPPTVKEHEAKQLAHSELTHEDFLRMRDDGCPVCKAQQKLVEAPSMTFPNNFSGTESAQ